MFLKVFLISSCLVLNTTSMPTPGASEFGKKIEQLKFHWDPSKMNCSDKYAEEIHLVVPQNLCETIPDKFCQIRKTLNEYHCTGANVQVVQKLLDVMSGNVTCQLQENNVTDSMKQFLNKVKKYISSLRDQCN